MVCDKGRRVTILRQVYSDEVKVSASTWSAVVREDLLCRDKITRSRLRFFSSRLARQCARAVLHNVRGFQDYLEQAAAKNYALTLPDGRSWRYEGGELVVELYFDDQRDAVGFLYVAEELNDHRFAGQAEIDLQDPTYVTSPPPVLSTLRLRENAKNGSELPPWNVKNFVITTNGTSALGRQEVAHEEMARRAVDRLRPGLPVVRMLLKDPSPFEELKGKEYNFLYGSRDFHDYFEGMHTNEGDVIVNMPLVAIRFDDEQKITLQGGPAARLYRVHVVVECRPAVLRAVGDMLKEGTKPHKDGHSYCTFVDVQEPDKFIECLAWKYMRAKTAWKALDEPARSFAGPSAEESATPGRRTSRRLAEKRAQNGL